MYPKSIIEKQIDMTKVGKENDISVKSEMGKYLLDVSKLILGGVVLSSVLDLDANKWTLIAVGTIVSICIAAVGFSVLTKKK